MRKLPGNCKYVIIVDLIVSYYCNILYYTFLKSSYTKKNCQFFSCLWHYSYHSILVDFFNSLRYIEIDFITNNSRKSSKWFNSVPEVSCYAKRNPNETIFIIRTYDIRYFLNILKQGSEQLTKMSLTHIKIFMSTLTLWRNQMKPLNSIYKNPFNSFLFQSFK